MKTYLAANIIGVKDVEKAVEWYKEIFGMELIELKLPYFSEMKLGESIFLIEKSSPERALGFQEIPTGVKVSSVIGVEDIKEFIEFCKSKNVNILLEPIQQEWGGWNAMIEDLSGNKFIIDQDVWD